MLLGVGYEIKIAVPRVLPTACLVSLGFSLKAHSVAKLPLVPLVPLYLMSCWTHCLSNHVPFATVLRPDEAAVPPSLR